MASLTPQQVRVLMMLSEGLLNKQIAYELTVSEATVKAVEALRTQTRLPIVAKPASCGLGPAAWATMARRCVRAGARFVGGCCGTDPEYIRLFHGLS
jgi:S-methylmethionine-dependent homocysteine/selenocysteine methylase